MKKLTLLLLSVFFLSSAATARTVDVSAAYTGASHFNRVDAQATIPLSLNAFAGIAATMTDEKIFKDPVYSVSVPFHLDFDFVKIHLNPFYYFENKTEEPQYQDASAFGIHSRFLMTLQNDEVNDIYTHAFVDVAFARQKGTVFFDEGDFSNQYYSQMAYTLGLHKDFYRAFGFELMGSFFQYPDGITGVSAVRGVLNQQDLAFTQTFDVVHDLAKYTLATRLTRMWADNGSTLYAGYRFGEYYTADPEHSFIIGNSFLMDYFATVDVAYNHVRTTHNENKRDIFYIRLGIAF